jgi:hypothetical protein
VDESIGKNTAAAQFETNNFKGRLITFSE